MEKFLIAGLGNPGRKYNDTRHNIGFWIVDELAQRLGLQFKEETAAPKYMLAEAHVWHCKLLLLKPLEYMNRSGGPVAKVARYFQINTRNILTVHDDLDVPFGRLKFVRSGGHGGHNGVRSIIEAIGTKDFPRLKVGIGRPPKGVPADRFVLGTFAPDEIEVMKRIVDIAADGIEEFVKNGIDSAMNKFNAVEVTAT